MTEEPDFLLGGGGVNAQQVSCLDEITTLCPRIGILGIRREGLLSGSVVGGGVTAREGAKHLIETTKSA